MTDPLPPSAQPLDPGPEAPGPERAVVAGHGTAGSAAAGQAEGAAPESGTTEADPPENPKRGQILAGAREMFLAKGFEGASMQDVARAAGVSKGTLYVYFDNKEAVFEALVMAECGRMSAAIRSIGSGHESLACELRRIGLRICETLLKPEVLASMRMMIGAAEKFPGLAAKVYAAGPSRSVATLAEYIARRQARGEIRAGDAEVAAAQFLDLCIARLQRRHLLMVPVATPVEVEAVIEAGVATFLRAWATGPQD